MKRFGLRIYLKNFFYRPNKNAVFIFGFQKSGTSAIASLLAEKIDKSVTIDTHYLWHPNDQKIISGELKIKDLVTKFSYPFSSEIIKEPTSTFFIEKLQEYFYLEKYIFIIRNPFDNIRSILNRLNLPGDKDDFNLDDIHRNWRSLFNQGNGQDYIGALANKWVEANGQLDIIESKSCTLIRYEDFLLDKEGLIEKVAVSLGYTSKKSIEHIVDKQFQPKGNNSIDLKYFYKEKNYQKIENICGDLMAHYNYKIYH